MAKAPLMFTLAVPFMDSFGLMEWMLTSKCRRFGLHCLFSLLRRPGVLLLIVFCSFSCHVLSLSRLTAIGQI